MSGEPLRIVIADNSPLIRHIFTGTPTPQFAVRAVARTRAELVRAVQTHELDAVLCGDDLCHPMEGVESLRALRDQRLVHPDTALILMVDNPAKSHLLACTQAQPDAILLKPFSLQVATTRVERAVAGRLQQSYLRQLEEKGQWSELLVQAQYRQSLGTTAQAPAIQFEVKALEHLDRAVEAEARLKQVLAQTPGLMWAEEALSRRELIRGDWIGAENRLNRLVTDHPSHVAAQELLYELKLDQGDNAGAQRALASLARFTGCEARSRELGDLALLNGDVDSALLAYGSLLQAPNAARPLSDLANYVRARLLKADSLAATQCLTTFRMRGGRELLLPVLDLFTAGGRSRSAHQMGQAQAEVFDGLHALDALPAEAVLPELHLLAVEQCLAMELTHQATERSRALLQDGARSMSNHQAQWLFRLHDWARDKPDDAVVPLGLRAPRQIAT